MTAVIGILNKHAVAIAADSAVTVNTGATSKIFNRANKLFRLSKKAPVGLMIYNQGYFMGIPWEVIVKHFRNILGNKTFPSVEGYKNEFVSFLKTNNIFSNQVETKNQVTSLILQVTLQLLKNAGLKVQRSEEKDSNKLLELFKAEFKQQIELYIESNSKGNVYEEFEDFNKDQFDNLGTLGLQQKLQEIIIRHNLGFDITDFMPLIRELSIVIIRHKNTGSFYSGLVFVGYGEDEIFPCMYSIKTSLLINNRLRWYDDKEGQCIINNENRSSIRPFAQTDVINTVLSGIDPNISELYMKNFTKFFVKHNETIADLIKATHPDLAGKIRNISVDPIKGILQNGINREQQKVYIKPMMDALTNLSKEDLAEMAESLIYLTYLKRRFTFAEESVGGPVDVAIITKGDGFIWIKRKHYFKQDLNQHFFKNY